MSSAAPLPSDIPSQSPQEQGITALPAAEGASLLGKDKNIMMEHDKALQRLEQLQNELIGGERAGNCDSNLKRERALYSGLPPIWGGVCGCCCWYILVML